jgi:hypothetical protein
MGVCVWGLFLFLFHDLFFVFLAAYSYTQYCLVITTTCLNSTLSIKKKKKKKNRKLVPCCTLR